MSLFGEIRTRGYHILGPVLGASAVMYFAYHAVQGEHGLNAWWQVTQQIKVMETKVAETERERSRLERRVRLMRPESLDPDMLEEQARRMLNYVRDDEIVILLRDR